MRDINNKDALIAPFLMKKRTILKSLEALIGKRDGMKRAVRGAHAFS